MSNEYSALLDRLLDGNSLTEHEAFDLMHALAGGDVPAALAGALLAGLRAKGETPDEIRGFATAMRNLALHPAIPDGAPTVDTVGTGGDGSGSLNLSTGTGLLAAACGARVVKHGNRSISSRSGSADMLECLGMPLPLQEKEAVDCLEATGFTFLFAPAYHPAMKAIMPVRGALAVRTVFNMLGPLTNPALAQCQLLGVYDASLTEAMARALLELGTGGALVVHCDGLDEIGLHGVTRGHLVKNGNVELFSLSPEDLGLERAPVDALCGGEAAENASILRSVLEGERGPRSEVVAVNAAAALFVSGLARDLREALDAAREVLRGGRAQRVLERYAESSQRLVAEEVTS